MLTESQVTEMVGVPLHVLIAYLRLPVDVKVREVPNRFDLVHRKADFEHVDNQYRPKVVETAVEMQLCRPFKIWWHYHERTGPFWDKTLYIARASEEDLMFTPKEVFMQVAEIAAGEIQSLTERRDFLTEVKDVLEMAPDLAFSLRLAEQREQGAMVWLMDAVQKYIQLLDGQVGMDWRMFRVSLGAGVYRAEKDGLPGLLNAFRMAVLGLREAEHRNRNAR